MKKLFSESFIVPICLLICVSAAFYVAVRGLPNNAPKPATFQVPPAVWYTVRDSNAGVWRINERTGFLQHCNPGPVIVCQDAPAP